MSNKKTYSRTQRKNKATAGMGGKIVKFIFSLIGIAILALGALSIYWIATAPEMTEADIIGTLGSQIVDPNGEEIYTLGGNEREIISPEEVPPVLEDAVLAIEDQRFYSHFGIDPIRLGGAVIANITDGFGSEGGSTITQQLVKLSVFSTDASDQTIKRKVQEAWLAIQLERNYSKEQILTFYINKVYMSDNIYGMGTASEYYYSKPASELALHEAALLAGMPQAPNSYNPHIDPEAAEKRRDTVLYAMVNYGAITEEQATQSSEIPVTEGIVERSLPDGPNLVIDSYVKQVLAEVEEKTNIDPYSAGATIYTTIDRDAQQHLYDVLNSDQYIAYPNEEFQAAVSIVDTQTGQVKALGGGRNQEGALAYNRATELNRSIGSTMKPLSVYGPAIEQLNYSTYHQLEDSPYEFPTGDELFNYDNRYVGDLSMREALVDSRNIPTARLLEDVGLEDAEKFLTNLGIENLNGGNGLYWSNAIGGEVTPLQLSASYAAFGNEGEYNDPYTVSHVVLPGGEEIDLRPESTRAMSDHTAYMVTDMLKDAAGTNSQLSGLSGIPHAGKTGTTNYSDSDHQQYSIPDGKFPDRWYAGYTSNYSVAVWTGYDYQLEPGHWMDFNEPSAYIALQIYAEMMGYLSQNVENTDWQMPDSVVEHNIIDGTDPAVIAPSGQSSGVVTELFVEGNEPSQRRPAQSNDNEESVEDSSESEDDEVTIPTIAGLAANYNESSDELQISWNPVTGAGDISYQLSINNQTYETSATSASQALPPVGTVTISVRAIVEGGQGPASSITVNIGAASSEEETPIEDSTESEEEAPEPGEEPSDPNEDTSSESEDTTSSEPPEQAEGESGTSPPEDENTNDTRLQDTDADADQSNARGSTAA